VGWAGQLVVLPMVLPSSRPVIRLGAVSDTAPTLEMLRSRRDEITAVARRHRAKHIRVFGSVSRGEATEASDVDFLVDFDVDASLLDQVGLIQELRQLLGLEVDVVSSGGLRPQHDSIREEATEL
jgi:uncharacterized protein